ncbi:MAG TPA: EF-hand domain-containing protein [Longimicrobiales bacterium]|nr:EF-hand domain-containing protein [Longimicrobiales bacterium]
MLSDLQKQKLTRYFRVYDVDDDGAISLPDFERVVENVRVLHGVGERSSIHSGLREGYLLRWSALSISADKDRDGRVDLDEWLAYWEGVLADDVRYQAEIVAVTERLFEVFDTDEDGVLGADEFCNFYGVYGLKSALARQVFVDLDEDGDGRVTRNELMDMAHQFYRSEDPSAPGNRLFGSTD